MTVEGKPTRFRFRCNGIVTNPFLSHWFRLCEGFSNEQTRISFGGAACRMKQYLSIVLALVCTGLVVSLVVMKRGDNAQHENDAGAIADFSNRLESAQMQIAACNGMILLYSNRLEESRSASSTFSNRLIEAESTIALDTEQITNLNRQVAGIESENQTLGRRVMDLTNQVADLTSQISLIETNLDQANKDYALLEDRLRRDVAERVVVERKFNNLTELGARIWYLQQNPAAAISAESIYAGLDVEVKSNGTLHVISRD
jgi:septal ring factor EnvC (AmiA/AmiB activator)